jgi:PAS domain S-box-containing protein
VLQNALSGFDTANFELPLMSKWGKRYTVLLNATSRRDADGAVTGVVGVGQDISQLNEATANAKHVADDLTRLIETANAPIFGVDVHGLVNEWNNKAGELLGFSKDETLGKSFVEEFIQPEDRDSVQGVLQNALSGFDTANYELTLLSKSGKRYAALLNMTSPRDAEGFVTGVVGVGQDISEGNEAGAEAKLVSDDLTRLIDTANAPIFGVDPQGLVTEWNSRSAWF